MITRRAQFGILVFWLVLTLFCVALFGFAGYGVSQAFGSSKCRTVPQCHAAIAWQKHDRAKLKHELVVRWRPSVTAAVRLAANVSGVSFDRLWTISGCESTHNPLDVLGQYEGLFQLGRRHRSMPDLRGLSPFDPYANAMHAALFIARHGESEWSCRSDGSVAY